MVSTTYAASGLESGPGGLLASDPVARATNGPPRPPRPSGPRPPPCGLAPATGGAPCPACPGPPPGAPPRGPPPMPPSGTPVEPSFGKSASSDADTEIPSFTSAAAALRFAGVIRLIVPAWSSWPHFPQLESSVIQRSTSSFVRLRGYFSVVGAAAPTAAKLAPVSSPALANQFRRVILGWIIGFLELTAIVVAAGG